MHIKFKIIRRYKEQNLSKLTYNNDLEAASAWPFDSGWLINGHR